MLWLPLIIFRPCPGVCVMLWLMPLLSALTLPLLLRLLRLLPLIIPCLCGSCVWVRAQM